MKIDTETKYCQTCGIPLDIDYANLGAGQNEEYCDYCLIETYVNIPEKTPLSELITQIFISL